MQGERHTQTAQALRDGDLDAADISDAERLLLQFVQTLTRHAYQITDEQVQELRDVGWTDPQIAEAVYDAALFNFFVRLADTFGIQPPPEWDPAGPPSAVANDTPTSRHDGDEHPARSVDPVRAATSAPTESSAKG